MNVRLVKSESSDANDSTRERMIGTLKELLRETFRLRNQGAPYAKLTHSQGYADGFMRMMTDLGLLNDAELLAIIRDVRRGMDGPATAKVEYDPQVLSA